MRALAHLSDSRPAGSTLFPFDRVGVLSLVCAALSLAAAVGLGIVLR